MISQQQTADVNGNVDVTMDAITDAMVEVLPISGEATEVATVFSGSLSFLHSVETGMDVDAETGITTAV